jgi:hypothetical protein
MTFVNDQARLNLVNGLLVFIRQRAAAFVSAFNGRVQARLLNVPGCYFKMLVNVHFSTPYWVMQIIK